MLLVLVTASRIESRNWFSNMLILKIYLDIYFFNTIVFKYTKKFQFYDE